MIIFKFQHRFIVITIFTITLSLKILASNGITNKVGGGHFGDHASHYIKSKWLAYKYNLEFYLQPFKYSDHLMASAQEKSYSENSHKFSRHISVSHESEIKRHLNPGNLIVVEPYLKGFDFHTEDLINYLLLNSSGEFLDDIRQQLQPKQVIPYDLPKNMVTVAVHIRKPVTGDFPLLSIQEYDSSIYKITDEIVYIPQNDQSKFSQELSRKVYYSDIHSGAIKFPPTQFYIDQIRNLSNFLHDAPMFVQLFTSDSNPQQLCEIIKNGVDKKNVTFGEPIINWNSRVIEDYYFISRFDCLIKSISTFSSISQLIGDHAITIYPGDFFWKNNTLVISKNIWLIRAKKLENLKSFLL